MTIEKCFSPGDLVLLSRPDNWESQMGIVITVSDDGQVVQIALNVDHIRNEVIVEWQDLPKTQSGSVVRKIATKENKRTITFANRLIVQTKDYIRNGGSTDLAESIRFEYLTIANDICDQLSLLFGVESPQEMTPNKLHFASPLFSGRGFSTDPKLCLVLMPFFEALKPIYDDHIKNVCNQLSLTCKRADDIFSNTAIVEDIWQLINTARLIIADLTNKNPNVFYEIGIAHTVGKDVILITQNIEDVPFDLRHLRYIQYAYTPKGMKEFEAKLKSTVRNILDNENKKKQQILV